MEVFEIYTGVKLFSTILEINIVFRSFWNNNLLNKYWLKEKKCSWEDNNDQPNVTVFEIQVLFRIKSIGYNIFFSIFL